jgi:hypothetical protein
MSLMMSKVSSQAPLPRTQRSRMTKKYRPRHAAPSRSGRIAGRVAIGALGAPLAMFAAAGPAGAAPLVDDNGDSSVGDTAPGLGLPDLGATLDGLLDTAQLPGLPGEASISGLLSQLTGAAELPTTLNPAAFDRFDVQQVQRWHQDADDADWSDEDSDDADDDSDWDDDDEDYSASDWDDDDDDSDWDDEDGDDDEDYSDSSSDDDGDDDSSASDESDSGDDGGSRSGGSDDSGDSGDSGGSSSTNAENASSNSGGGSGVVGGLLSSLF